MDVHKQAYIYDKYPTLDAALYRRSGPGKHLVSTGQIYRGLLLKRKIWHDNGPIYTFQAQTIKARRQEKLKKIPISKIITPLFPMLFSQTPPLFLHKRFCVALAPTELDRIP